MTTEEAIKTAIDYETRIRDIYAEAAENAADPVGRRVFRTLRDDEQSHLDYLLSRLQEWQKTGEITVEKLETVIPARDAILRGLDKLERRMSIADRGDEKQMLSKALKVETETSDFYRKMVAELSDAAQQMFAHFLEIEERHIAAVQAELDYVSNTGYWFDFKEFDME